MKISYKLFALLLLLVNFIEIKEVQADDLVEKFNEKLIMYLKEDAVEADINTLKNEKGENFFAINIGDSYEIYTRNYFYKNGIITFDFKKNDLNEYYSNGWIDNALMLASEKALCDIKGYNYDNYIEWELALDYEQIHDSNLEQDGVYFERDILEHENGFYSEYIKEYSINLVDGFKSYESSSIENVKNIQKENFEEEKDTNMFDLKYLLVVFLLLIGVVEIIIIIFYFIKKRK